MTGQPDHPALPSWARDPDVLEEMFHAAIKAGDAIGVDHSLRLMAGCDPHRAQRLFDDLKTALHIAAGGAIRVQLVPEGPRP